MYELCRKVAHCVFAPCQGRGTLSSGLQEVRTELFRIGAYENPGIHAIWRVISGVVLSEDDGTRTRNLRRDKPAL